MTEKYSDLGNKLRRSNLGKSIKKHSNLDKYAKYHSNLDKYAKML
jgi:hypothetical protein